MHITEMKFQNMAIPPKGLDTIRNIYRAGYVVLFKKHKVTPGQFQASVEYYTRHPDVLNDIYDDVITNLTEMESELHGKKEAPAKAPPPQNTPKSKPSGPATSPLR